MPTIPPASPQPNILIVDDTLENLQVLSKILKQQGYKVRPALSGEMALQGAQSELPDLILLDINMPGMNGYQLCEHLKADEQLRSIPIIFISALSETLDKVKAFTVGGVDYITKPFQIEEVQARVKTHLELHRLQNNLLKEIAERKQAEETAMAYARQIESKNRELEIERKKLEATYRQELDIAHQIQTSLLPIGVPELPGLEVATFFRPAEHIGGDLYNYSVFDPEHVGIAVGDASGKGLPAALMMSLSVGIISSQVNRDIAPASLLRLVNTEMWPHTQRNKVNVAVCYVTLSYAETWSIRVANAGGVSPILVCQREQQVELIEIGGLPLGMVADAAYHEYQQSLAPGDMVILSSDGIVEAMNSSSEIYGFERLLAQIKKGPAGSAQAMTEWILADIHEFVGEAEQHDDTTLIVILVTHLPSK